MRYNWISCFIAPATGSLHHYRGREGIYLHTPAYVYTHAHFCMQQWISVVHTREFSESLCISQQPWIVKASIYMSTRAMQRSCSNCNTCGACKNCEHFVRFSNVRWQVWTQSQEEKNLSKDQLLIFRRFLAIWKPQLIPECQLLAVDTATKMWLWVSLAHPSFSYQGHFRNEQE